MKTIAFFDTKSYDRESFLRQNKGEFEIRFFEDKLTPSTVGLANGCDAVCAFVNDTVNNQVINKLYMGGVTAVAMRCAGYNNVDLKAAKGRVHIFTVPGYSPYSVAEHTAGMLLTLNRKLHKAYIRTRDQNFSLERLIGFDLHGKTAGIIGTGRIGCCFANICRGFGMEVLGFDVKENPDFCGKYCTKDELLAKSDVVSLHCPLTRENRYLINAEALSKCKNGVYLLNTSRGLLVDTVALTEALKSGKVGAAGLDVYEEESDVFFENKSDEIIDDDILIRLIAMPNVIVTSHQAFLTREALSAIAETTLKNLSDYFNGKSVKNEIVAK